ncbi:CD3324 family protein [Marinilactibacillus kalidii]|uniref:CD3324 family protein n=1 Tax=Marinilactibacillus kalidii TaxID=2820274 RepID=UPI001ABE690C|nr:CD3324 family protein [Marinilactibacillus kalidii]
MRYVKATTVLPEDLLLEIQKYLQGETIYIPKQKKSHKKWGTVSGERKKLDTRNLSIKSSFNNGKTFEQLSKEYFLSIESLKKIVYTKK